jgi:hypothetical protein
VNDAYAYDAFISFVAADQAWVQRELMPRLIAAGLSYALGDQQAGIAPWRLEDAETLIRNLHKIKAALQNHTYPIS